MPKSPKKQANTRKHFSPAERSEIVFAHFAPLLEGKSTKPLTELAREFGTNRAATAKIIREEFREGRVKLVKTVGDRSPQRVQVLESELRNRFPALHHTIVIDDEQIKKNPVRSTPPPSARKLDDIIHMNLGEAASELIASGLIFRDDDRIVLGSGRGVFHTVESLRLRHNPQLRAENIRIASVTGVLQVVHHFEPRMLLDADFLVSLLSCCFANPPQLETISHPLLQEAFDLPTPSPGSDLPGPQVPNPGEKVLVPLQTVRDMTVLGEKRWKEFQPTHAIVGVGVLDTGHQLYELAKAQNPAFPVPQELISLAEICDQAKNLVTGQYYCPVADICNRLFPVPPPPGLPAQSGDIGHLFERVKDLTDIVNSQLLTISEHQLKDIKQIMLVAGTERKARAIRTLLEKEDLKIRFLITCATVGKALIASPAD